MPNIKTEPRVAEINWFSDMSGGDTEFLGEKDTSRASTFDHCLDILLAAERNGFHAALLPTAYQEGLEPLAFALAAQRHTRSIQTIVALRMGEIYPTTLLRSLATLDQVSRGRFIINAISSDFPGQKTSAQVRYDRTAEMLEIMIQAWERDRISFHGEYYQLELDAAPSKCQYNRRPQIYFGGISPEAKSVAARYADVYLMWPEKIDMMAETIHEVSSLASQHGRRIDFGLRIHVVARETEQEARDYARRLASKILDEKAFADRSQHQDAHSYGVFRQDELRKSADDDGFIEPLVWSTVGKVFAGCGSALVGSGEQIAAKIDRYLGIGFRKFIFSGFPLIEEADYFGRLVIPRLGVR